MLKSHHAKKLLDVIILHCTQPPALPNSASQSILPDATAKTRSDELKPSKNTLYLNSISDGLDQLEQISFDRKLVTEQFRNNRLPITVQVDRLFSKLESNVKESQVNEREAFLHEFRASFPSAEIEVLDTSSYSIVAFRDEFDEVTLKLETIQGELDPVDLESVWEDSPLAQRLLDQLELEGFSSTYRLWVDENDFPDALKCLDLELFSGHYFLDAAAYPSPIELQKALVRDIRMVHLASSRATIKFEEDMREDRDFACYSGFASLGFMYLLTLPILEISILSPSPSNIFFTTIFGLLNTSLFFFAYAFTRRSRKLNEFKTRALTTRTRTEDCLDQLQFLPKRN